MLKSLRFSIFFPQRMWKQQLRIPDFPTAPLLNRGRYNQCPLLDALSSNLPPVFISKRICTFKCPVEHCYHCLDSLKYLACVVWDTEWSLVPVNFFLTSKIFPFKIVVVHQCPGKVFHKQLQKFSLYLNYPSKYPKCAPWEKTTWQFHIGFNYTSTICWQFDFGQTVGCFMS